MAGCKTYVFESVFLPNPNKQEVTLVRDVFGGQPAARPAVPLITMHGNIAYIFDYRARLDTPFAAANLQQHSEQVYADAVFKGVYPFRVFVNARQSNSGYFKNFADINVVFNHGAYQQGVKDSIIAAMIRRMGPADSVRKFNRLLNERRDRYYTVKRWVENPARVQEAVQEKERLYRRISELTDEKSRLADKFEEAEAPLAFLSKEAQGARLEKVIDSLKGRMHEPGDVEKRMQEKRKMADSLYGSMMSDRRRIDSFSLYRDSLIRDFSLRVRNARSARELEDLKKEAGGGEMASIDRHLLALTRLGIGRNALNYSDLTVSNISVNGVNIEYNPSFYAAFAAGSVDYLFRDFVLQPGNMPRQNLVTGRFGWGDKERRVFIFTVYNGTKNSFGGPVAGGTPAGGQVNNMHVLGYSFEVRYKLDANKQFTVEAAKSSSPYSSAGGRSTSMQHAFAFSDHNNEALAARFDMKLPATHTELGAFYKLIGADFQSYSIFRSGTRQEGWGLQWRQYFLRQQLLVSSQVKKSNFDDPLLAASYSSALLFKSVQVVYRRRKWPVIVAGYMPSTQLIKSPDGRLSETVYYTLTGGVYYHYRYHGLRMNSSLNYSQFYNRGTDSGFVRYNARMIQYTHGTEWGRLRSQTDIQYTDQPGLKYWLLQERIDMTVNKYLAVGGELKHNYLPVVHTIYWGWSAEMSLRAGNTGSLRIMYSKDYISNGLGGLTPNDWGRAIWTKVF